MDVKVIYRLIYFIDIGFIFIIGFVIVIVVDEDNGRLEKA